MRPNNDDPDASEDGEEQVPRVDIPPTPTFPPPPDVQYTRPTLGRSVPVPTRTTGAGGRSPNASERPNVGVIKAGAGLAAGLTFGASVVGGIIVGRWLDHKFPGIAPWGTLGMLLIGIVAGFLNIYRLLSVTGKNGQ